MKKIMLFCLLALMKQVYADSIAIVLFTNEKVIALRNGVEMPLKRGAALSIGDEVHTGPKALANIRYNNSTLVNIGEDSQYKIISYDPQNSDEQIKAQLTVGKVKIQTNGKTKETLETPIVALAILGTTAAVYVQNNQATFFKLIEGNINNVVPGSYLISRNGLNPAPFPSQGTVRVSPNAPGTIVLGASSSGVQVGSGAEGGASDVILAESTQLTTQTAAEGAGSVAGQTGIADISCF